MALYYCYMEAPVLTSEQEYLHSSYDPDCELVDGQLLERNVGEREHSITQGEFTFFLGIRKQPWRIQVFPGQRIRIAPARYRVPDICVYREPAPREKVFSTPPWIVIEILSSEDRMSRIRRKIDDYLAFGVPHVWLIDPEARTADVYTPQGFYPVKDLLLRTEDPAVQIPLPEIFRALDE